MVDTQRTSSDLLTSLFVDGQTDGSITAQDIRDLIVSLTPPFGSFYVSTAAATTIGVAGTFVKAAGTTTSVSLSDFTMPSDNRLTYTGAADRHMHIACSVSMTTVGVNDNLSIAIAKNGTVLDHSKMTRFVSTGTDQGSTATHADVVLSTNDYLEIFITNEDATADTTLTQGYLFVTGVLV